jgi:hypothetical protein
MRLVIALLASFVLTSPASARVWVAAPSTGANDFHIEFQSHFPNPVYGPPQSFPWGYATESTTGVYTYSGDTIAGPVSAPPDPRNPGNLFFRNVFLTKKKVWGDFFNPIVDAYWTSNGVKISTTPSFFYSIYGYVFELPYSELNQYSFATAPEPQIWSLLFLGFGFVGWRLRASPRAAGRTRVLSKLDAAEAELAA